MSCFFTILNQFLIDCAKVLLFFCIRKRARCFFQKSHRNLNKRTKSTIFSLSQNLNKWNNNKNIPLYSFPLKYKKNPLLLSPYLLITNHLYYNRITNFKQPINIGYLLKITFQTNKTDGLIYHISMQIMIV